jgi:aspartyl aminopeptidase
LIKFFFIFENIFKGVDNVKTTLTSSGFKELKESEQWNIEPLGKVKEKKDIK